MPSINFVSRVITIPQSELTLIGNAVYQLDANVFRLAVLDIMDGPGIIYPDVFRHNTAVTLGGVTYARFVEVINGYTLTFENGNYAVRVIGANTNFEDVTNVNSVSIRSANSAGLIQVSTGSGLSSDQDSRLTAVNALASRLNAMLGSSGAYDRWLATALELGPAGGGIGQDTLDAIAAILANTSDLSGLDTFTEGDRNQLSEIKSAAIAAKNLSAANL